MIRAAVPEAGQHHQQSTAMEQQYHPDVAHRTDQVEHRELRRLGHQHTGALRGRMRLGPRLGPRLLTATSSKWASRRWTSAHALVPQ